jgi:hypothetical protein
MIAAGFAYAEGAAKIIPVSAWPRVLNLTDKQIVNPSVDQCVKAGYRLIPVKPITPSGKRIKSETLVQDDKKSEMVKFEIIYEDIPAPEILTNVPADKVVFTFTTNGIYRGVKWVDGPKTNGVK